MKLTEDILRRLGFRGEGKDFTNHPAYRIKIDGYHYGEIQIVLGPYPDTNPNCGIVSLYQREEKDKHCLTQEKDVGQKTPKKIDYVLQRGRGYILGYKYMTFPERVQPLVSGVSTIEKLQRVIKGLTGKTLKLRTK